MPSADLYAFKSDDAVFVASSATGRVQSAKWTGPGPVIPGISSDINQSCERVLEYVKEKYPEIWVSDDNRDINVKSAKKTPFISIDTKYECAWFETIYFPNRKTSPHFNIGVGNSVEIIIDPTTGMIPSYEETYTPLNPTLNLKPTISEEQAGELAKQYFEKSEIVSNLPLDLTNEGLHISTDENGRQYLVWALKVEQHRNHVTYGGLVGIDAHDGHIVYHATF